MEGTISLGIYDAHGKLVRVLHKAATADEFVAALDGFITHWDGLDDAGKPMPPGRYDARGYMVGAVKVRPASVTQKIVRIPARIYDRAPSDVALSGVPPSSSGSETINAPVLSLRTGALPSPAIHVPSEPLGSGTAEPVQKVVNRQVAPPKPVLVSLVDNPLDRDRAGSAELIVGFDAGECWLELADGLPLVQISPAPASGAWGSIMKPAQGQPLIVTLNTAPGELHGFTITNISDMMAFDCGSFDFAGVGKW